MPSPRAMFSRLPVIPEPRSRIDIHIYYLYIPRIYEPNRKLQAFFKVQKSSEGECPPAQFKSDSIPASATVNPVECSVPVRSSCCSGPADRPLHWDLQRNLNTEDSVRTGDGETRATVPHLIYILGVCGKANVYTDLCNLGESQASLTIAKLCYLV